ncbi:penicillin-binding protein 1A [Sediminispirochaeta smaragdinae]|uniref:peptidoglycan glycosyltransferase n=1 Tax=Sediminispirochaeta smaragdinae (strain DSM 11293 / JCM 15392 / SEBR 4228) TaxID=573413 RepID=E1R689_SEDSS|nr:PBP1A family penicillin-binding protein [Sediminispirochaeta smaragdinae]ADK80854.1 penicillin-binding protein, 1A family [Sediminispirochaeta smaragdinae DSM 11293]
MIRSRKRRIQAQIIMALTILCSLVVGFSTGFVLSQTFNTDIKGDLTNFEPALPTQILDCNGELITEIFSDEKRDIVPITKLPKTLILALISREDLTFFQHHGFSFRGTARAAWNVLTGSYFSGGSTLTQQVAGRYYADRTDISIFRKLKELWYAFQLERDLTKYEILELYANDMYFGHNAYGVEAASRFYFGHSAEELTVAESAILVIQLASPALYSPINHPERARSRQKDVLDQMVANGFTTREEAEVSFQNYWNNYDFSRSNIASAYFDNESKAPYFSEYVRIKLNDMLYGAVDINKDGYIVHTTLDLGYQRIADEIMSKAFVDVNEKYRTLKGKRLSIADDVYVPIADLLALTFNLEDMKVAGAKQKKAAVDSFYTNFQPPLEALSLLFGSNDIMSVARFAGTKESSRIKKNFIEGALISMDHRNGHILAMVGGSDFETKQYNRAVDAKVQPGSSIKPLYYSAAISSGKFTPATRLYDGPIVFYDDMGNSYQPLNYLGTWDGSVLLRYALATSMNVPSLQVLEGVGFETAIDRISKLLGMEDRKEDRVLFPRSYPLGLGVTSVAPINMVQAFSTFPNHGKRIEPIAITQVLDRNGNTILEPEKERLREMQKNRGKDLQIMSPQAAYIMVSLLQSTVEFGTLRWRRINVGGFDGMPMAGKTGTTQNWGDAWTVGFSPYITTAVWLGFDTPGNSLGREITGATAAGPIWAEYMKKVHAGLEPKEFERPSGIVTVRVCAESGMLPTKLCDHTIEEVFIAGTEPKQLCPIHSFEQERDKELVGNLQDILTIEDFNVDTSDSLFDSSTLPDINFSDDGSGGNDTPDYNPLLE